jgi:hypothetical protein
MISEKIKLLASIILLFICFFIFNYSKKVDGEYYTSYFNPFNEDGYRLTPYTESQYKTIEQTDPGFGFHMWQFQNPKKFNMNKLIDYSSNWKDGDFGRLVSHLEDRDMAPYIKNLP